jgi:hypothetical protein
MTETATKALQDARHELDSLGGLWVTDATEDNPHGETWQIDTTKTINKIEQALARYEWSLSERIEAAYDETIKLRDDMALDKAVLRAKEEAAKLDHADEWEKAKNSEVRSVLLAGWLADDSTYAQAYGRYMSNREDYRLALLEIERLKLLVELAKAGDR